VVVIAKEKRNKKGVEERKKEGSSYQEILVICAKLKICQWCLSPWLTQNDENDDNDCDCSGHEGRFPMKIKV